MTIGLFARQFTPVPRHALPQQPATRQAPALQAGSDPTVGNKEQQRSPVTC